MRILSTAVLFLSFAASPPMAIRAQSPADQLCVLAGHVSSAATGEPLRKTSLRLALQSDGAAPSGRAVVNQYATVSEGDGSFRLENIQPGDYLLSGQRFGYLDTQYGAKRSHRSGTMISLRAGQQLTDLNFPMIPQSVVSGKIVDVDGDPVTGSSVQALQQRWVGGKLRLFPSGVGQSNDLGEYRISTLRPGKYYVYAQGPNKSHTDEPLVTGKPDVRPVRTFYPDALSTETAMAVDVKSGQDLPGVNIRLHTTATYHLRGKIAGDLPESERGRFNVTVLPRDNVMTMNWNVERNVNRDRTFDIDGVAPGPYSLILISFGSAVGTLSQLALDVGEADVNNIVLAAAPPGSLRGNVRMEGPPGAGTSPADVSSAVIRLSRTFAPGMMAAPTGSDPKAKPQADGTFSMERVPLGMYELEYEPPQGTYLKSFRIGSQEALGKDLDFRQGVPGNVEIVLRYGAGEVDATVRPPQASAATAASGQPTFVPTASVVLVPETLNEDGSGIQLANTKQTGTYTFKNVAPGRYRAYAFEDVKGSEVQIPDLLRQLEPKSTEVEVKENDHKQIQLTLIPSEALQQILATLGIDLP